MRGLSINLMGPDINPGIKKSFEITEIELLTKEVLVSIISVVGF